MRISFISKVTRVNQAMIVANELIDTTLYNFIQVRWKGLQNCDEYYIMQICCLIFFTDDFKTKLAI